MADDAIATAIKKLLDFDVDALARKKDFGEAGFQEVVPIAKRIQGLYRTFPISSIPDLPGSYRGTLLQRANADHQLFHNILVFNKTSYNNQSINHFKSTIDNHFEEDSQKLLPIILYSVLMCGGFQNFEAQAQTKIDEIENKVRGITEELEEKKKQIDAIMDEIREAAAEQGVSHSLFHKCQAALLRAGRG